MKHELKLTGKQLSEILNVSPQRVSVMEKQGILQRDPGGLFSLSDAVNKDYLKSKNININKIVIPTAKPAGRTPAAATKTQGTIKTPSSDSDESMSDLNRQKKQLEIQKLKIENEFRRGLLLDGELVQTQLFYFLDQVCSRLERNGSAFLTDHSARIVSEGGVTAAVKHEFKKLILDQFDLARNETVKRIQKIKENQK